MDDLTRHPDDATLFDLVEGTLDPARAQGVHAHLERCSACAAFVRAANAGAPDATTAVVSMPEPAAERLRLRMSQEWRTRVAAIGAAEQREDAAAAAAPTPFPTPVPVPVPVPDALTDDELVPLHPTRPPVSRPAVRRGWTRRLVPLLGVAVLAGLAGTSVWLGDQPEGPSAGSAGDAPMSTPSTVDPMTAPSATAPTAEPFDGSAGAGADTALEANGIAGGAESAGGAGSASPAAAEPTASPIARDQAEGEVLGDADDPGTAPAPAPGPPPLGYDEMVPQVCVVAFDEAQLALPDGRIPERIIDGPFGMFLVCG